MAKKEEIEVTLAKDHTHKGKAYTKGDKIEVTPGIAKWMYANGVATDTSAAAAKESK